MNSPIDNLNSKRKKYIDSGFNDQKSWTLLKHQRGGNPSMEDAALRNQTHHKQGVGQGSHGGRVPEA